MFTTERRLKDRRESCEKEHDRLIEEVRESQKSKLKIVLDWVKSNVYLSLAIFLCALFAVAALVFLLHFVDIEKVKNLKDAASSIVTPSAPAVVTSPPDSIIVGG